ncbi:hypothetical protein B0H19DRAFT_1233338 [Mycena capillaripes]|nr:hypothetical protein B0H19DRAFT_1233338 [Mycena capillaripes]
MALHNALWLLSLVSLILLVLRAYGRQWRRGWEQDGHMYREGLYGLNSLFRIFVHIRPHIPRLMSRLVNPMDNILVPDVDDMVQTACGWRSIRGHGMAEWMSEGMCRLPSLRITFLMACVRLASPSPRCTALALRVGQVEPEDGHPGAGHAFIVDTPVEKPLDSGGFVFPFPATFGVFPTRDAGAPRVSSVVLSLSQGGERGRGDGDGDEDGFVLSGAIPSDGGERRLCKQGVYKPRQVEDSGGFVNASIPVSAQNNFIEVDSQLNRCRLPDWV